MKAEDTRRVGDLQKTLPRKLRLALEQAVRIQAFDQGKG